MSEPPEGMINVEQFSKMKGIEPSQVIEMIRDGFYVGRKVDEEWFVGSSESIGSASKPSQSKGVISVSSNGASNEVIVTDIKMPFASMVVFMVMWVIASIPAFIILLIMFTFVTAVFGGVFFGVSGLRD